jgi:hypothetical protein
VANIKNPYAGCIVIRGWIYAVRIMGMKETISRFMSPLRGFMICSLVFFYNHFTPSAFFLLVDLGNYLLPNYLSDNSEGRIFDITN